MERKVDRDLYNIFPELFYAVDRSTRPNWFLDDVMNDHNIMLVYDGSAEFSCNGHIVQASKGDLIYYKTGDARKAHTHAKSLLKCFAINFAYTCPVYVDNKWSNNAPPLPFQFHQRLTDDYLFGKLISLFTQLIKTMLSPMERAKSTTRTLLTEILTLLFQSLDENMYSYSNERKAQAAIDYMLEHFSENITLNQLASHVRLSESYLGKIFKAVTGKPPIDYLIDIRINQAKMLLHEGVSVTETSRRVGFNDIYYFSRAFKNMEGICPSAYVERVLNCHSHDVLK
jgi:AraC-like DNA-binding protein